jgi:hypothetical protein
VTAGGGAWYGDGGERPALTRPEPARKGRKNRPVYILWNGQRVKLRLPQMLVHGVIGALLFGCLAAGFYFGGTQVDWHIPGVPWHIWLKPTWDAGRFWPSWLGHWAQYRHTAFRDQAEPEVATLGVLTLIAKPRWWPVRVSTARLVAAPFILIIGVFGLGILGVWLNLTGLPWLWAHAWAEAGRPGYNLDGAFAWAARFSVFVLVWGFLAGRVLHRWWAPVGATIQGFILDRSADRYRDLTRDSGRDRIPLWVRLPLVAPVVRERWSHLYLLPDDGRTLVHGGRLKRFVLTVGVAAGVWLILLGIIGHYVVGTFGVHVPYLAP